MSKKIKKLTNDEALKLFQFADTKRRNGCLSNNCLRGIAMLFDVSPKTVQRVVNRRGRFKNLNLYIDVDVSDL